MKKVWLMSMFLLLMVFVVACGGETNTDVDVDKDESDSQSNGDGEEVTISILSPTIVESPEGDVERGFAEAYMAENPNVKIEFIEVPMNNAFTQITTMATGNQLPDIVVVNAEMIGRLHDMEIIEDLHTLLDQEYIDGFFPAAVEQMTMDDQLLGFPFFTIPMGLLYRTDWFEEAGLTPPETWEEFTHAANELTTDDRWGFAMVGSADGSGTIRFIHKLRTFGVEELYQDEGGNWVTGLDNPKALEAFEMFTDLYNEGVVPPGALETSYGEAISLMANEQAGMMITGPHSVGAITARNPELEDKLGSVPIPRDAEHITTLGTYGLGITKVSEHKEVALDYLKFIVETENALTWNAETGRIPSRLEAGEHEQVSGPTYSGFLDALDYAIDLPGAPFYPAVQSILGEAYQSIMVGGVSVEDAVEEAIVKIEEEIQLSQ